jgi:hypothetical protein
MPFDIFVNKSLSYSMAAFDEILFSSGEEKPRLVFEPDDTPTMNFSEIDRYVRKLNIRR